MDQPYKISAWLAAGARCCLPYRVCFFWDTGKGLIDREALPAGDFLQAAREAFGASAFLRVPTLLWLDSSDRMIAAVSISGAIFAVAAFLLPRVSLARVPCAVSVGRIRGPELMSFQWDLLLLEAEFWILFLDGTRVRMWLVQWLLFRLMFLSGVVKLTSGDQPGEG